MEKNHLNLLSKQFCLRALVRKRLRQWAVAWLSLCVCGAIAWWVMHSQVTEKQQFVHSLEQECSQYKTTEHESIGLSNQLNELRLRQSLLGRLENAQTPLHLIGIVGKSAQFADGRIKIGNFSYEHLHQAPSRQAKNADKDETPQDEIRLTLKGTAQDNFAIAKFIAYLRESQVFLNVELRSSVRSDESELDIQTYLIECTL